MKQLTLVGKQKLEWQDVPEPKLEDGRAAIVRPLAVATCDVDVALLSGRAPVAPPYPFGHEGVAEVVETGADVRRFAKGDRVVVPFQLSCGECEMCATGRTGSCRTFKAGAAYGMGAMGRNNAGMLADLVLVPRADHMLTILPADVSPEAAASVSDNVPDAWRTVAGPLKDRPDSAILIVGGGAAGIPFYAIDIALALGASQVDYIDTDARRLGLARRLGAHVVDAAPPRRHGSYPITIDASANEAGLHCAIRSTEPEGTCTSIGIYFGEFTPMPLLEMYTRGITFKTGRVNARPLIPNVLDFIAAGRIHPDRVTETTAPWADAAEVLSHHTGKTIITRTSGY